MQFWMTQLADWMDQKEKSVCSDSVLETLSDSAQQTFLETEVLLQSSEQLQSAYMRVMETYDKY